VPASQGAEGQNLHLVFAKGQAFADRLEAALKERGFEPLIDRSEIYAFEDWWKRIKALIGRADTIVFVLSPDAVQSDVALKEVKYAAALNKRFAPVVYRQVHGAMVPEALQRLNYIFFNEPAKFEEAANRLADALQTDIDWIRQHTEYGDAERRWAAAGRHRGLLFQSPALEIAEHWLASRPHGAPEPTTAIRAFVSASRQGSRAAQRIWRMVVASIFALLVAIILGLVGWINESYLAEQWRWYTLTRPYLVAQVRPYVLSAATEQALKPGDSFKECAADCPQMIVVPARSFIMGSRPVLIDPVVSDALRKLPQERSDPSRNERPKHRVTISKPFAVSKFEVTFSEWDTCVAAGGCNGYRPSDQGWGRRRQPVINITWDDAQHYVAWLSLVTGKIYRLLSESEYEYATRAGTQTAYPWGDHVGTNHANCMDCGSQWDRRAAPVGSFAPNGFGLYDMVGNVTQWVEDCYHDNYEGAPTDGTPWMTGNCTYRVMRGGAFFNYNLVLRSAFRNQVAPIIKNDSFGFRVARTL
jgi:formylglycine-generating enzyme required for sulfatase activity